MSVKNRYTFTIKKRLANCLYKMESRAFHRQKGWREMRRIWRISAACLLACSLVLGSSAIAAHAGEIEKEEESAESAEHYETLVNGELYEMVVRDLYAHPGDSFPIDDFANQVFGVNQETPRGLYPLDFPVTIKFSLEKHNKGLSLNQEKTKLTVSDTIMNGVKGAEYVQNVKIVCYKTSANGDLLEPLVEDYSELRVHSIQDTETKVSNATVYAPKTVTRKCSECGRTQTRVIGKKLPAKITANASTVPLKTKQSTKDFSVKLAAGDTVAAWTTSDQKIATVSGRANGSCTIKAGTKTGTAKITIRTKAGAVKTIHVKVQKGKVNTSAIKQVPKKITLKKGKTYKLSPSLEPITSTDKAKYSSGNRKIASVNSKGVITAKNEGQTKITVKAGRKKATCTIVVKKSR